MGTIASQITSLTIVYSTAYSGADQRKHQSSASLALFPAQMASNAENVSIWWCHHEICFVFFIIYLHWDGIDIWDSSSWQTRTCLVSYMAVGDTSPGHQHSNQGIDLVLLFQHKQGSFIMACLFYYIPRFHEVERGYTGFTLPVCPFVDRNVSALYLQQYLADPFRTSYQATSEGVSRVKIVSIVKNFGKFFKFVTLTLSSFYLGYNMNQQYG